MPRPSPRARPWCAWGRRSSAPALLVLLALLVAPALTSDPAIGFPLRRMQLDVGRRSPTRAALLLLGPWLALVTSSRPVRAEHEKSEAGAADAEEPDSGAHGETIPAWA